MSRAEIEASPGPREPSSFRYFAYGSNMLTRRITAEGRAPSAIRVATGFVAQRRLTFDKVSVDGSGKCDAEATEHPADRVFGVVFEVSSACKASLDRVEGLGVGYDEEVVDVHTDEGILSAHAYIATRKAPDLRPYDWYKALVVAGAVKHGLPTGYVEWLRKVEAIRDPDRDRRRANEALLPAR